MTILQDRILEDFDKRVNNLCFEKKINLDSYLIEDIKQFLLREINLKFKEIRKDTDEFIKNNKSVCIKCGMSYDSHRRIERGTTTWMTGCIPCGGHFDFIGLDTILEDFWG